MHATPTQPELFTGISCKMESVDSTTLAVLAGCGVAIFGAAAYAFSKPSTGKKYLIGDEASFLENGKLKQVKLEDGKEVLILRTSKGKYRATGTRCPHYNVSLASGIVSGDKVVCSAHAACFDTATGDIEDGPSLDRIPTYPVTVENGKVYVSLPKTKEALPSRIMPDMCPQHSGDNRNFVIIGAGPAGQAAAETLRREGYGGRITMLTREAAAAPYDRVKLSKDFSNTAEKTALRPSNFYRDKGISVRTGVTVTEVKTEGKVVVLEGGETIKYDKLLCASGGPARTFRSDTDAMPPYTDGAALANIFPLRDATHSAGIASAIASIGGKGRVVIVGSSFIGMEAASVIANMKDGPSVTVIGMEAVPFERVLGPALGKVLQSLHESKKVTFKMQAVVTKYNESASKKGCVGSVTLQDIKTKADLGCLEADLVIIGAGIIPATQYLAKSQGVNLKQGPPGGVMADSYLCAGPEDVFVAGDIAFFPYPYAVDQSQSGVRIEHWDVALDQGRTAARNMLGQRVKYDSVPFFWTNQYGKSIRSAGYCTKTDEIIVHGNLDDHISAKASIYYVQAGKVASCVTIAKDPYAVAAMELIRLGAMPTVEQLKSAPDLDLPEFLRQVTLHTAQKA